MSPRPPLHHPHADPFHMLICSFQFASIPDPAPNPIPKSNPSHLLPWSPPAAHLAPSRGCRRLSPPSLPPSLASLPPVAAVAARLPPSSGRRRSPPSLPWPPPPLASLPPSLAFLPPVAAVAARLPPSSGRRSPPGHASLGKSWTSRRAREVVSLGRELLGGNGILTDFLVAKMACRSRLIHHFNSSRFSLFCGKNHIARKKSMEGKGFKSVLISALILGLVLEHIQVEAKSCCPSTTARNIYNTCRFAGGSRPLCAKTSGCKIVDGKCQPPNDHLSLSPHSDEAGVIDFCKLGCTSSVCNNINAFVGSEEVNDVVERCNNACYRFCTKDVDIPTVVA